MTNKMRRRPAPARTETLIKQFRRPMPEPVPLVFIVCRRCRADLAETLPGSEALCPACGEWSSAVGR